MNSDISIVHLSCALERWRTNRNLLARFFNTFSYLEHVGARKIHASRIAFTTEHLQHAAEESRHALRLKQIAQRIDPSRTKDYEPSSMLGGRAAHWYFQRLDASVRRSLREHAPGASPLLNYLLVTLIVETRAAILYPALQQFATDWEVSVNLKGIIAEEDRHLQEIQESLTASHRSGEPMIGSDVIAELLASEEEHFARFIEQLITEGDRCVA